LYALAGFALLGGFIGAFAFAPGPAGDLGWGPLAHFMSFAWFAAGVVEAALFAAAGSALAYLQDIAKNTAEMLK
jgi:hypothetical protein